MSQDNQSKITAKSTTSNFLWRFMERCGAQGVTFIVSIVLARLLDPKVYGTVALVTVFTAILQVFVDSGFGNALVQKKNADNIDFSTVFFFNITVCTALYLIMFFCAPFIASFYKMPELTPVVRVMSLTLIISGVKNIQQSYVSKNLLFKKFFFATLGGTIGAAFIGIGMAYAGFGVWAIVAQNLFNQLVDTIILWVTVKWRPQLAFSFKRLKGLFSYGWKLLVSSLITVTYTKIRQLIIGKFYSSDQLAFYNEGDKFPSFVVANINSSIDSVLFPVMAKRQENKNSVRDMTRKAICTSGYFMWPMMLGLCAVAKPLVELLLTEKWIPCVPFLRIFALVYAMQPIQTANLNAIKAIGRSDIFLKLEIIKKIVGLTAMMATIFISVEVMAYSFLVTTVLSALINAFPNKKLLNYSFLDQIKDILPYIVLSVIMFAVVYPISLIKMNCLITVIIQVVVGSIVYIAGSIVFKLNAFYDISNILKAYFVGKEKENVKKSN